jgi:hypothetical protein
MAAACDEVGRLVKCPDCARNTTRSIGRPQPCRAVNTQHQTVGSVACQCDRPTRYRTVSGMNESATPAASRSGWLLLLLSSEAIGASGPPELDPLRIQKGMFLLSMRGPARDLYTFQPYDWGPFSSEVYADLDGLTARGYLNRHAVPGKSWSTYEVTSRGYEMARSVATLIGSDAVNWLRSAREYLTTRSFSQLLREIYAEYPRYAVNSKFEG